MSHSVESNHNVESNHSVESKWQDPATVRSAVIYVVAVLAIAGIMYAVYSVSDTRWLAVASIVPAIALIGAFGAFIRAYSVWRAGGVWPIWEAAGYFLLIMTIIAFTVPASSIPA